jgi:hypothetical protein
VILFKGGRVSSKIERIFSIATRYKAKVPKAGFIE